MNRRNFVGALGAGAAAARAMAQALAQRTESTAVPSSLRYINKLTGAHPYRVGTPSQLPNIFLITLDMVSPDHYHPSRTLHREMNLPAIGSLQADSVLFNNAFCASPVCAPARAALQTGRYTYIMANGERVHDGMEAELRASDVIFPEYLRAIGYHTKHAGKSHLGTQKFMDAFGENDNAWNRWAPPIYDDEEYLLYLRRLGVKQQRYKKEIWTLQQDRKSPLVSAGGWIEQSDGKPFPLQAQYTHYLVQKALDKLDTALMDNQGDPIYLQVDIFDPHQPFSIPDGFQDRERQLRPACSQLPVSYRAVQARDWKPAPYEAHVWDLYRKNWGLYDPETVRDYRVGNALQMEVVDKALEQFLTGLKRRGLYNESLIIFTSDHGEMNGRQALVDKGVYLYPDVLRVPFAVKMPESSGVRHHSVEAPVCHMDIVPTLLSMAGVEPMERLDGISLLPHLTGASAPPEREIFVECGWHSGVNFACGITKVTPQGHYLYGYNISGYHDELYDLSSTDAENLAPDGKHKNMHAEMVARLGAMLEREPRWGCYAGSFRIDHYFDLPKPTGDIQMFRPK